MEKRRTGSIGEFGLGYRGYYGFYTKPENNIIVQKMNEIVDEYNSKIGQFHTYEEQYEFSDEINRRLKELSNEIIL